MRPDWSKPSFFPAKPEGLSQTKLGGTMRTFKIYQIRVNNEVYDFVNKDGESHTSAGEKYPEYKAKLETQRGHSRGWSDSYFQHYKNVCDLKVDAGLIHNTKHKDRWTIKNCEDVFRALNGYYYDDDAGEDIVLDAHLVKHSSFHSLSVGDIVEDPEGNFFFCDSFGFHKFTNPNPFHDVLFNGWNDSQLGKRYSQEVK